MSDEQKDAVIGRVIREKKEAEQKLKLLNAEARHYGEIFSALGASLNASPEYIAFEREPIPVQYHSPHGNNRIYKREEIDAERLIKLTADIRATLMTLANLTEQASGLGV